jgi:hypothetical protein
VSIHERLLRNQRLRNLVPPRAKAAFAENRVRLRHVAHRSDVRNIYHCCVHKTGSQWIRKVFADPEIYRVTGLRTYAYGPRLDDGDRNRSYSDVSFDRPFPARRIVSPLYIPYESFVELPKPEPWRAFFVLRDPRDVVVSWYFSSKSSHPTNSSRGLQRTREQLATLDEERGMIDSIHRLGAYGLFGALRSWAAADAPQVMLVRYEDLIGEDGGDWWERLLDHCRVPLSGAERDRLLSRYSFQALSGRQPGHEDTASKLRKGVAGDWRNHFTPAVRSAFDDETSDLVVRLGYAE